MVKQYLLALLLLTLGTAVQAAGMGDDPLLAMFKIDKLEVQETDDGNPWALNADGWLGRDLHKLWVKVEAEVHDGETEEAELQLLYSRAFTPFWDLQIGVRHDFEPTPERDWLAVGVNGLAPYFFEVDASLFVDEDGVVNARLDAEYEYLFTQRLVLSPELEMNLYSEEQSAYGIGGGLSDLTLGLRLRYEVRREFAPYLGVTWSGLFGKSADYAEAAGGDTSNSAIVAGIRAWF